MKPSCPNTACPPIFSQKRWTKIKKKYHDLNLHNIGTHIRYYVKKKQRSLLVIYFPTLVNVLTCLDLAETVFVMDTLSNQHSNLKCFKFDRSPSLLTTRAKTGKIKLNRKRILILSLCSS